MPTIHLTLDCTGLGTFDKKTLTLASGLPAQELVLRRYVLENKENNNNLPGGRLHLDLPTISHECYNSENNNSYLTLVFPTTVKRYDSGILNLTFNSGPINPSMIVSIRSDDDGYPPADVSDITKIDLWFTYTITK